MYPPLLKDSGSHLLTKSLLGEKDYDVEFEAEFQKDSDEIRVLLQEKNIKASEFLKHLKLPEEVINIARSKFRREPEYCLEAQIKAIIHRRILKIRFYTEYQRHLEANTKEIEDLGFETVPDHETLRSFEKERLGIEGLKEIRRAFVKAVKKSAERYGIIIGKRVGKDSTPLPTKNKDKEGKYNVHYKIFGYLSHYSVDLDYNLPLDDETTEANAFDGNLLIPSLEEVKNCNIEPETVYGDNHYCTYENYAAVAVKYKATSRFRLAVNTAFNEKGTLENIRNEYRKLWKEENYRTEADFDYMEEFLFKHGKFEEIGALYRNSALHEFEEHKEGYLSSLFPRSKQEGFHGYIKEQLLFEEMLNGKGMKNAKIHTTATSIAVLAVALTKLQNGITEGLTKTANLC